MERNYKEDGMGEKNIAPNEQHRERQYCSRLGFSLLFILFCMVIWQLVFLLVEAILPFRIPYANDTLSYVWNTTYYLLLSSGHYLISLPLVFRVICRKIPFLPPDPQPVAPGTILRWFVMGTALMSAGAWIGTTVNELVFFLIDKPPSDWLNEALVTYPYSVILLGVCFFGPIAEEIIFRYLLAGRLARYGQAPAAFVSALLFGLFHTNLSQFFYAFALGILFAYAYFRTGHFWVPCLLHILANLYGSAIPMLIPDKAFFAFALIMLAINISGLGLLLHHRHGAIWQHGAYPPTIRVVFGNFGMIAAILACFITTTANFLAS